MKIQFTVKELIDHIVDHNSIVALWETDYTDPHYSNCLWRGEGWRVPEPYTNYKVIRVFSAIADSVSSSDVVNIQVEK